MQNLDKRVHRSSKDFLTRMVHSDKQQFSKHLYRFSGNAARNHSQAAKGIHLKKSFLPLLLASFLLLSGCTSQAGLSAEGGNKADSSQNTNLSLCSDAKDTLVPLAASPALPTDMLPNPSGEKFLKGQDAVIDYSNISDGYVMVKYTVPSKKKLKVQVKGPSTTYTYNLDADNKWVTFPLSDGNGSYQVTVYKNIRDSRYASILSQNFSVSLKDEFAPFLHPNQYVDYSIAPKTVAKANSLTSKSKDTLKKVQYVYNYVVKNIHYDKKKAGSVKSGYLPDLDAVLKQKKGICFDYAALMAGMLRSQGIPCKLVVGYAGSAYHAWISVWTKENGWVDGVIYFDGSRWNRMDPTFASSGNSSKAIMKYIGDGKNYTIKYIY